MRTSLFSLLFLFAFAVQNLFGDYCFPSSNPPAGKDPATLKQFITIIWDDNTYSGLNATPYESKAWMESKEWKDMGRIGGKAPLGHGWIDTTNDEGFEEGDMGFSWAISTLVGTRLNPDGSPIHFTFNVISGQMATVYGINDSIPKEGTMVGYNGESFKSVDWELLPNVVERWTPSCWGREYAVFVGDGKSSGDSLYGTVSESDLYGWKDSAFLPTNHFEWDQPNWTQQIYFKAYTAGHEIGNHTIDHMESNSGLPRSVWPNDGEGFDSYTGTSNPTGVAEIYAPWDVIGWNEQAGKTISTECWADAIQLGEDMLDEYLSISVPNGNLFGFRAPRIEVNGNLFFALKEKGYLYDCSLEEGFESIATMGAQLWPYTLDNGSPNGWFQTDLGEISTITTLPSGVWEIPINVIQIPEQYLENIKRKALQIDANAQDGGDLDLTDWDGKINGFDFNMYILYGMTREEWVGTMKVNLYARITGNKAPLHIGAHTDYYTVMYDRATLMSENNLSSYGLVITEEWNNFQDRIDGMEEFVDYAIDKGAYFVSGKELIDSIKIMQEDEVFGDECDLIPMSWMWTWFCDEDLKSSTTVSKSKGGIWNAHITVDKADDKKYPLCGYALYEWKGFFAGMTHISLTYKSSAPLALRLLFDNDKPWEVILNNLNHEVESGKIPMEAFRYNPYSIGKNKTFDPRDIYGIEVQVLTAAKEVEHHTISLTSFSLYGGEYFIAINAEKAMAGSLKLISFTPNKVVFTTHVAGRYDISIVSINGKTLQQFNGLNLKKGINRIKLNNLTSGVYIMKIKGTNIHRHFKATIL